MAIQVPIVFALIISSYLTEIDLSGSLKLPITGEWYKELDDAL